MAVMVCTAKEERATEIDEQSNASNADCFIKMDCQRKEQAPGRFASHQKRHDGQHHSAGKSAEHTNFARPETESLVRGVSPREIVGEGRYHKSDYVSAHVPAISQQRHRVGHETGGDLHNHHHGGEADHHPGSLFRLGKIRNEVVCFPEMGMISWMHLPEDSAIIASAKKAVTQP